MTGFWSPQPGPQVDAATCPADLVFFGGARGGGKSDCAIGRQMHGVERYAHDWNGLMIRRKFKDLAELKRRFDSLIAQGMPAKRMGGDGQGESLIRFSNGGTIRLTAVLRLEQVDSLQGQQFTEITIDEAPNFAFLLAMLDKLRGCLRSPAGVPCRIFLTGNPGGPGHNEVKNFFIDAASPNTVIYDHDTQESRIYIPSRVYDNKILMDNDPKYEMRLRAIKDPVLRKAWLDGDWSVFIGQAFNLSHEYHVIPPMSVPERAPLYMTFDWGFGAPFSIGWWWVDQYGRVLRFAEWYGSEGPPLYKGLRITDGEIASQVIEKEKRMGIWGRHVSRIAGPDCFQKKPDYRGGGQGPSTSEQFALQHLYLQPGDPSRESKIRQFRERLAITHFDKSAPDYQAPMMLVYDTCMEFIRTIPSLCMDEDKVEDIDTDGEDHVYDESCHIVMARPIALQLPEQRKPAHERRIDELLRPKMDANDEWIAYADHAQRDFNKAYGLSDFDYGDEIELDDGRGYNSRGELIATM